jgi:hypothetical protein
MRRWIKSQTERLAQIAYNQKKAFSKLKNGSDIRSDAWESAVVNQASASSVLGSLHIFLIVGRSTMISMMTMRITASLSPKRYIARITRRANKSET